MGQSAEHLIEFVVEVFARMEPPVIEAPALPLHGLDGKPGLTHQVQCLGRTAVNKLGPKLDRNVGGRIVMGVDASADAVACFQHANVESGRRKRFGSGESSGAGSNDHDIVLFQIRHFGSQNGFSEASISTENN